MKIKITEEPMTVSKNEAHRTQTLEERFNAIDKEFNDIFTGLGKLDAIANLIDLRTDDQKWMGSERGQYAVYHCCENIEKMFAAFSKTHDEYQGAINDIRNEYIPASVILHILQTVSEMCNGRGEPKNPEKFIRNALRAYYPDKTTLDRVAVAWMDSLRAYGANVGESYADI